MRAGEQDDQGAEHAGDLRAVAVLGEASVRAGDQRVVKLGADVLGDFYPGLCGFGEALHESESPTRGCRTRYGEHDEAGVTNAHIHDGGLAPAVGFLLAHLMGCFAAWVASPFSCGLVWVQRSCCARKERSLFFGFGDERLLFRARPSWGWLAGLGVPLPSTKEIQISYACSATCNWHTCHSPRQPRGTASPPTPPSPNYTHARQRFTYRRIAASARNPRPALASLRRCRCSDSPLFVPSPLIAYFNVFVKAPRDDSRTSHIMWSLSRRLM
jgi:hypothetical protein